MTQQMLSITINRYRGKLIATVRFMELHVIMQRDT